MGRIQGALPLCKLLLSTSCGCAALAAGFDTAAVFITFLNLSCEKTELLAEGENLKNTSAIAIAFGAQP